MEDALVDLIRKLEALAPYALELAQRQVRVEVACTAAWSIFFGIVLLGGLVMIWRAWRHARADNYYDPENVYLVGAAVALLAGLVFLVLLSELVPTVLNPEWAALQLLLRRD